MLRPSIYSDSASTKSLPSERVSRAGPKSACWPMRCFNEVAPFGASVTFLGSSPASLLRRLQRSRSLRSECHGAAGKQARPDRRFNEVAPFGASVTQRWKDMGYSQDASTKSLPSERVSPVRCSSSFWRHHASTKSLPSERVSPSTVKWTPKNPSASTKSLPSERVSPQVRRRGLKLADGFNEVAPFGASVTTTATASKCIFVSFNEVAPFGASVTRRYPRIGQQSRASTKSLPSERVSLEIVGTCLSGLVLLQRSRSLRSECHNQAGAAAAAVEALQRSRSLRSECHHLRLQGFAESICFNEVAPFGASVTRRQPRC